ncbi:MAG: hypothetical protein MRY79_00690 [Alphaproteobacteria bacterium]|nr:hypothetical protein [Alphaproteobacteria bacterium]
MSDLRELFSLKESSQLRQNRLKSFFDKARKREERHKKLLRSFKETFEQFKDVFSGTGVFSGNNLFIQKIRQEIQKAMMPAGLVGLSQEFSYAQVSVPGDIEQTLMDEAKEIETQIAQAEDTQFVGPLPKQALQLRQDFNTHPKDIQKLKEEFLLSHGIIKAEENSYLFSEERIKKMRDKIQSADNASAHLTRIFIFSQTPTQMERKEYLADLLNKPFLSRVFG